MPATTLERLIDHWNKEALVKTRAEILCQSPRSSRKMQEVCGEGKLRKVEIYAFESARKGYPRTAKRLLQINLSAHLDRLEKALFGEKLPSPDQAPAYPPAGNQHHPGTPDA